MKRGRAHRDTRLGRLVATELRRQRGTIVIAATATIGSTVAAVLTPWPLKVVFDQVLLGKPATTSLLQPVLDRGEGVALAAMAVLMLLLALARAVFLYLQLFLTTKVGYEVMRVAQRALFAHLQRLSLGFHSRSRSGELLTRVTNDTATIRDVFATYAVPALGDTLTLFGMFVVMALMDWQLALVPLLSFPALFLGLRSLYRRTKDSSRRQRSGEGRIAARVGEVLTAVSLVQAYGRERYEEDRLDHETAVTMQESIRTARLEAANSRTVEAISALATAAVVVIGALRVNAGALTPGELLVFTGYLTAMYKPVRNLAKASSKLSRAAISAERIGSLLEVEQDIRDADGAVDLGDVVGEVEFADVRFGYDGGKQVLHGATFRVAAGSRVSLVGASGAGKSTIAALLMRLYDPTGGSVRIDGRDITDVRVESLRSQIAFVPQGSVIFASTVRENIAYGRVGATDEEIVAAAKAANAHDFISALPDGYDTVLGERGASISGGQARRIAIARAIVRDASILILDEPMTGLDVASEASVQEALDRLMAGRTCLTITHDLTTCADADEVVMLEKGRIVAQGRHADLLGESLSYRRLVQIQGGAQVPEPEAADADEGAHVAL